MDKEHVCLPRRAQSQVRLRGLSPCPVSAFALGTHLTWTSPGLPTRGSWAVSPPSPHTLRLGFQTDIRSLTVQGALVKGLETGSSRIQSKNISYLALERSVNSQLLPRYMGSTTHLWAGEEM